MPVDKKLVKKESPAKTDDKKLGTPAATSQGTPSAAANAGSKPSSSANAATKLSTNKHRMKSYGGTDNGSNDPNDGEQVADKSTCGLM